MLLYEQVRNIKHGTSISTFIMNVPNMKRTEWYLLVKLTFKKSVIIEILRLPLMEYINDIGIRMS